MLKDQILSAVDRPHKDVPVKEWGVTVRVKTLSGAERDAWEISIVQAGKVNKENIRARLLVRTLIDEQGNPIFDLTDAEALGEKSGQALERLFDVAARLNGIRESDIKELKKTPKPA